MSDPKTVRKLVDIARAAHGPPPGAKERILSRLSGGPGTPGAPPAAPRPGPSLRLVGAGGAVAATVAVVLLLANRDPEVPVAPSVPVATGNAVESAPPAASERRAPEESPVADAVGEDEHRAELVPRDNFGGAESHEPPERGPASRRAPPPLDEPEPPPVAEPEPVPAGDGLELLARAQRELRQGDAAAALTSVAEHRTRFPSSTFEVERATIEALASCALGRVDDARRVAEPVLRDHPRSPGAQRLRESCVGAGEAP